MCPPAAKPDKLQGIVRDSGAKEAALAPAISALSIIESNHGPNRCHSDSSNNQLQIGRKTPPCGNHIFRSPAIKAGAKSR
jgi:hypothetical protein